MEIMEFLKLLARVRCLSYRKNILYVQCVPFPPSDNPWDTLGLAGFQPESQNIKKSFIKGGDSSENICITLPTEQED